MKSSPPFVTSKAMCDVITEAIDVKNMAITDITFRATGSGMVNLIVEQLITYEQFSTVYKALDGRAG